MICENQRKLESGLKVRPLYMRDINTHTLMHSHACRHHSSLLLATSSFPQHYNTCNKHLSHDDILHCSGSEFWHATSNYIHATQAYIGVDILWQLMQFVTEMTCLCLCDLKLPTHLARNTLDHANVNLEQQINAWTKLVFQMLFHFNANPTNWMDLISAKCYVFTPESLLSPSSFAAFVVQHEMIIKTVRLFGFLWSFADLRLA